MGKYENFIWYEFGIVDSWHEADGYLFIVNTDVAHRKISIQKYASSIAIIKQKIDMLKGKPCVLRVSQNTKNKYGEDWSEKTWFSDIRLDKGEEDRDKLPKSGDDKQTQPVAELQKQLDEANARANKNAAGWKRESDAHENTKEELSDVKGKLGDKEKELSARGVEAKIEERNEKADEEAKREQWAKELQKRKIGMGQEHAIVVSKGHAQRLLALCTGIAMPKNQTRLEIKIKSDLKENECDVEVIGHRKNACVALGAENKDSVFAATFFHPEREKFNEALKKVSIEGETGHTRESLKDRTDIPLADFVTIYKQVVAQMNERQD